MSAIKTISENDFNGVELKNNSLSIVECFDVSSGTLHMMEAVFKRLLNEANFSFTHYRVNTRDNPFIIEQFYILREPTYLIFNKGKLIDKVEGLSSYQTLLTTINKHIPLPKDKTLTH